LFSFFHALGSKTFSLSLSLSLSFYCCPKMDPIHPNGMSTHAGVFPQKNWEILDIIRKKKIQLILLIFQRFSSFRKRKKKRKKRSLCTSLYMLVTGYTYLLSWLFV
jgi:hypothetical protein